jgi:hypothetical protein
MCDAAGVPDMYQTEDEQALLWLADVLAQVALLALAKYPDLRDAISGVLNELPDRPRALFRTALEIQIDDLRLQKPERHAECYLDLVLPVR